jgi:hypothetical protein
VPLRLNPTDWESVFRAAQQLSWIGGKYLGIGDLEQGRDYCEQVSAIGKIAWGILSAYVAYLSLNLSQMRLFL